MIRKDPKVKIENTDPKIRSVKVHVTWKEFSKAVGSGAMVNSHHRPWDRTILKHDDRAYLEKLEALGYIVEIVPSLSPPDVRIQK